MVTNLENVLRAYGDGNLFGEPYGEGPLQVVFLHGWARQGQDFSAVATELAASGISSVTLDLPGFGATPAPAQAGGARYYAELLTPTLEALGGGPKVLVGHSFGGRIAVVVAAQRPELVKALVLTGAPLVKKNSASKSPRAYRLARWLNAKGLLSDAAMEDARKKYGSSDYRNASGVMRDVLVASVNESYEEELSRVVAPVWMVWGENDTDVPVSVAQRSIALLGGEHTLSIVPGVGHLLPLRAPHSLVNAVKEALS